MLTLDGLVVEQDEFRLTADWRAAPGARIAVIGPSGGGKSTLLLTLAGFVAPAQGRILWDGEDIGGLPPGKRPMTLVFQDQNLFPHLTLAQNIGLGLSPDLRLPGAQHQAVERSLSRVGLEGLGGRKPAQVSGGQASRAALARALLRARPILMLDEPFSALGPGMKDEMLDLVAEVAQETGALVLMVTHDPDDARRIAPLTVLVDEGRALPPQSTRDLLANPPSSLRRYLGRA